MFKKKFLLSLFCLVVVLSLSATATRGANILFVASMSVAEDDVIKAYLEGLGHTVTYIDDDEDEATTEAAAAAADVVFISESVSSGKMKNEITEVAVPMIVGEPYAWDEMGMTEGGGGDDAAVTTDIEIVAPEHYLAAGLSGSVAVLTEIPAGCNLGKGITGPEATVIATALLADGVTYDVIFVYEKGAALPVAPADGSAQVAADIRIGLGLHAVCFPALGDNYYALLGAAVDYALGVAGPAEPPALLLRYPFNEGVGDRVGDVSGNDNHAVMHNMDDTSWVEGKEAGFGTCLALDGIDDYLTTDGFFSEPLDGDFTLSMWFTGTPGRRARLFQLRSGDSQMINVRIIDNILRIDDHGGVLAEPSGNVTVTDQQWHHFAIVRSGLSLIVYLDGNQHLEAPLQEVVTMDNVSIGVRDRDGSQDDYLPGNVDEFSIYTEALDLDQIRFLMEHLVFAVEPPVAPGPVAHWQLDEGSGTIAADSSGSGLDGAISGATWVNPGADGTGSCLDFDGQGTNLIDLGNFDVTGNGLTIACWCKADNLDTPGNDPRLFSKAIGGSREDHWFMVSSSRVSGVKVLRFRLKTDGATGELKADTATGIIDLDVWTHVVASWDGETMRLHKNGVEVGSAVKGGTLSTNPDANVAIGNQPVGTPGRPWDGLIDDVRLYNIGLSQAEIDAIVSGQ